MMQENTEMQQMNEYSSPAISWYPGHIAKAERELADYIKKVDVVIEVRDGRIPYATTHPSVPEWVGSRPLIVVIVRIDQISKKALADWREHYTMNPAHPNRPDTKVYFVDGKIGSGVLTLKKQALKSSVAINKKRKSRGIQPRAVRAAVIGFPNVGKSAIINRLLGKRMARSKNMPGVTRSLQWVRLGGSNMEGIQSQEDSIELLDSPGIIPAKQLDQDKAIYLAICNDIGEASYDRVVVASHLIDRLNSVHKVAPAYVDMKLLKERYNLPIDEMTGEEVVYEVSQTRYKGNMISSADRLLGDFRKGLMGRVSLEVPEFIRERERKKGIRREEGRERGERERERNDMMKIIYENEEEKEEREREREIVIPDIKRERERERDVTTKNIEGEREREKERERKEEKRDLDVGRGNYDGW
eukprot:CAMPEP_0182421788 /NCGR_PEP_ID=MMETSP1167-20130531/7270_1 /TAXON_ID=2988 /ORGANISM="Mallomonas Sp, Strain CCMP3275" /LENGTH=415 /DNA_ID=CAMNT_0024599267 /DNA_START=244 /DNA_END=1491 /DNA_ORIENTATION=+